MAIGRPRAFDRDEALDQALQVFWRKGYEGASLAGLTAAMGINPPSLYAAFGNKAGLFRAALDRYMADHAVFFDQVLAAPTSRAVAEALLHSVADLQSVPDRPPGCLTVQGALSCSAEAEPIRQELAQRRAATEAALRRRFERARTEGDLPAQADPAALARYLMTLTQGMAVQAAGGASAEELQQVVEIALRAWPPACSPIGLGIS
jgi:AcrR family transcriptional regulator